MGTLNHSNFSVLYDDGVQRLPIAFFPAIFNLLFLGFWFTIRKSKFKKGVVSAIFLMAYASIGFIARFFSNGYNPLILGVFDLSQLIYLLVLIFGTLILASAYDINVINMTGQSNGTEQVRKKFETRYDHESTSTRDRFSLSYSDIESSVRIKDLTLKEKLRILGNKTKRKFRK